jgi:hypothetical protein
VFDDSKMVEKNWVRCAENAPQSIAPDAVKACGPSSLPLLQPV